ncbi:unnamed protein product [Brassicogethes aeneus]|uniref:Uncharacterized protein n=1 Tax=Brassicogethes aeneus TaxID=1431903 RepID=A0A9P0B703_BRAAE|nr:unnamed protein product [Brassicogethes aeneus]
MVTSPFSLALNEPTQIVEHAVVNRNYYCNLLNLPTKPIAGLIPLNQVQNNGRNLNNVYIDVLGVLRGCGTPRTINTATGETFQVLHVEIFDVTAFSLSISLWDSDNILRASTWTPRYTVLFFTDVKLEWSDFEKAFRAKCTNRTVVTENPPCRETEFLLNYAKDAPIETFDIVDKMLTTLPEANQIQEIMSVNQIQNRVDSILQGITVDKQFSALVYAYITNMDLDGINKSTFAKW